MYATPAQIAFINRLIAGRFSSPSAAAFAFGDETNSDLTKRTASLLIDWLQTTTDTEASIKADRAAYDEKINLIAAADARAADDRFAALKAYVEAEMIRLDLNHLTGIVRADRIRELTYAFRMAHAA